MEATLTVDKLNIGKQPIPSIDFMRLLCAVMVVMIHVHPFAEYSKTLDYIFTQVIARIAVPFFFAVSGYLLSVSFSKKPDFNVALKYLKRILLVYCVWSAIYFIIQIPPHASVVTIGKMLKKFVTDFLLYGSYYHLWYFPALIFSVLVFSHFVMFKKVNLLIWISIALYAIGVLGISYNKIGSHVPLLNQLYKSTNFSLIRRIVLMGLPFFMLGHVVFKGRAVFEKMSNRLYWIFLAVSLTCFLAEIYFVEAFNLSKGIMLTIFLYPMTGLTLALCVKFPMADKSKYMLRARHISNFTYYAHPLFLYFISKLSVNLLGYTLTNTPRFFLVCFLTISLSLILSKINNRHIVKIMG